MPTILLIRHGESVSNAGLPTLRPENVALTERGIDQARNIAWCIGIDSHVSLNLIITSSYQRTKQTAVPTKLRFPSAREEEWPVHEFTYLSLANVFEYSTVDDRKPLVDAYWELCDPALVDGPDSESFEQFIQRVRGVMARFENVGKHETVVIFSHEQFICAVFWLLKRNSPRISSDAMRDFKKFLTAHAVPNGGILCLQRHNDEHHWQFELLVPQPLVAV